MEEIVTRSHREGVPYAGDYRIIRPDGTERVISELSEVEYDSHGKPIQMRGTTLDVTERKKAELALQQTMQSLEEAQRIGQMGSWTWDPEEDLEWWSDQHYRIFGLEPGSIALDGLTFLKYVHPDDRERVREIERQADVNRTPFSVEYRVVRPDGTERIVAVQGEWVEDGSSGKPQWRGIVQDITERKATEEKLLETAEDLKESQRIGKLGSWIWDIQTDTDWWSDEIYQMLGLTETPGPKGGQEFLEYVHPDDQERVWAEMQRAVREKVPYASEYRFRHADGHIVFITEHGETEYDKAGRPIRMRGTTQDITEQKAIEEKLRETAENLKESQRIGKLGSWAWDIDEDKEWWSDEIYRMIGLEVEAIAGGGYDFLDSVHPDDRDRVRAALDKAVNENVPYAVEYRVRHADGHEIFLAEHAETEYDGAGRPVRLRGSTQDITERKRIEQELSTLADSLAEAQRMARLGSWTWDPDEDIEWWSDELYRIFGLEPKSVTMDGYGYLRYVHPDDRERIEKIDRESTRDNTPFSFEYRVVWPDGTERIVIEWGEMEIDAKGNPQWRGTVQDITERKRIEQELARLNAELEQRVEERTAELRAAQGELVKSERLATLGQLTATVSHELRNPLGAMRTSMYVVEKKAETQDQRFKAAIDRVNRNITRCDQIIDELLDFTRIRDLVFEKTDIDAWLGSLLDEQTVPDGVEIGREFGTEGARIPADTDRLRRAVINIFENACQAVTAAQQNETLPSDPRVTVETGLKNGRLEISITDNGPGVPADIREKVFEPLFSTKNFGVGLGLPTVKQIMEQHGGGVEIGDGQGGGAKFALWLPVTEKPEAANP